MTRLCDTDVAAVTTRRSCDYVVLTPGHYLACIVAAFLAGILIGLLTFGPLS